MTMHHGRFAPSPTGSLHFGSLVAALGSWLFARAAGGSWVVRMEDIDRGREVAGSADDILRTLSAFGFESDQPVVYQSKRADAYAAALRHLESAGHAYRCWCSRSDLEAFAGIHPRQCVARVSARRPAWRVRAGDAWIGFDDAIRSSPTRAPGGTVDDFVVWRADGECAYQLAVVVDDAAQGITHVVRGADLLDSTPRQIFLQRLLGFAQPVYAHLPLVLGADGRKLSKQAAAMPVDARDPLPSLRAALTFLGQSVPDARTPAMLLQSAMRGFDTARIPRTNGPIRPFDALRKETC